MVKEWMQIKSMTGWFIRKTETIIEGYKNDEKY